MLARKLIFYVKPTERCNTDCSHCYNRAGNKTYPDLDVPRYRKFMDSVGREISGRGDNFEIEIVLHGGEPTLVGIDKLRKIIQETKAAIPFADIQFSMQTNMLLYDKGLTRIIKEFFGGSIGTSYSPGLRFRKPEQLSKWEDNLILAKKDNINIYWTITLSKEYISNNQPSILIDYLNKFNISGFHFEPLTANGAALDEWDKIAIEPHAYDIWKTKFTEEFIDRKIYKRILHNEIVRKAKVFVGGDYIGCCGRDCYVKVFTINSDGTIGSCPNKSKIEVFGSIDDGFGDIIDSKLRRRLIVKEKERRLECLSCDVFQYCNGGCVQTDGCYEGRKFYNMLKGKFDNDSNFAEWVKTSQGERS